MVDQSGPDGTTGTRDRSESLDSDASRPEDPVNWLTAPVIRMALAFLGAVLLLYALGRAAGVDVLGIVADVLATRIGRWLLVALFALLLIMVALRGFEAPAE